MFRGKLNVDEFVRDNPTDSQFKLVLWAQTSDEEKRKLQTNKQWHHWHEWLGWYRGHYKFKMNWIEDEDWRAELNQAILYRVSSECVCANIQTSFAFLNTRLCSEFASLVSHIPFAGGSHLNETRRCHSTRIVQHLITCSKTHNNRHRHLDNVDAFAHKTVNISFVGNLSHINLTETMKNAIIRRHSARNEFQAKSFATSIRTPVNTEHPRMRTLFRVSFSFSIPKIMHNVFVSRRSCTLAHVCHTHAPATPSRAASEQFYRFVFSV